MEPEIRLKLREHGKITDVPIDQLVIAGWTGRNAAAQEAHIRELEEIGIQRPSRTPIYYRGAAALLTTRKTIEVVGGNTSGEVEFVVISTADGLLITVGSDHTDREVEKIGVSISKQLCAKPICPDVWRLEEVADHWERLLLRAYAMTDGARRLYQHGPVTTIRDPAELISGFAGVVGLQPGTAMFCGTLAVEGEIGPADRFEIDLIDPVLGRALRHGYDILELPDERST